MGRPIVYCGDCGTSLREQDFEKGRARQIDHRPYCSDCRPPSASALPAEKGAPPARISTAHIPRVGTTRRRVLSRPSMAPYAAGGGVLALLALVVALASSPSAKPERVAAPPPPPLVVRPVAPDPAPADPEPLRAPPAAPVPAVTPPVEDPPLPIPTADPSLAVDRWLEDVRTIRARDPEFKRAGEIRALLRQAADIAGPRRAEVESLLAEYEKAAARPAVPVSPPPVAAPVPAAAPAVSAVGPRISATYTLIDPETEKPVPGYDPLPAEAVVDLGRLRLQKIDVRINLAGKVGSLVTVINGGRPHVENGPPWSFTANSVENGFTGWVPKPGRQTLQVTPYSEPRGKGAAGATLTFSFTIVKAE